MRFVKTLEEEVTVIKTQPLYLTCELNKERNVVWRKDGKIIKPKPGKFALGVIGLSHSLTVTDSDDADAGTYTVTVEDSELSCSSCVKVVGKQPKSCSFFSLGYSGCLKSVKCFSHRLRICGQIIFLQLMKACYNTKSVSSISSFYDKSICNKSLLSCFLV